MTLNEPLIGLFDQSTWAWPPGWTYERWSTWLRANPYWRMWHYIQKEDQHGWAFRAAHR